MPARSIALVEGRDRRAALVPLYPYTRHRAFSTTNVRIGYKFYFEERWERCAREMVRTSPRSEL
jgi:hypothetical protein